MNNAVTQVCATGFEPGTVRLRMSSALPQHNHATRDDLGWCIKTLISLILLYSAWAYPETHFPPNPKPCCRKFPLSNLSQPVGDRRKCQ